MILISGATGTNGQELLKRLLGLRQSVRVLIRSESRRAEFEALGVEVAVGDLSNPATLKDVMAGVDRALLLTGVVQDQLAQCEHFVAAAKAAAVRHIVRFSGAGAGHPRAGRLLSWHGECERMVEASGLAWTHLRPNVFYQNMLQVIPMIRSQKAFFLPLDEAKVAHVDVADIADVAALVLTQSGHEGQVYEITGPKAQDYYEVSDELTKAVGKRISYYSAPQDLWRSGAMSQGGMPEWMADLITELYSNFRDGLASTTSDTVQRLLGRSPRAFFDWAVENKAAFA